MKILFIWPNYDCPIGMSIGVAYLSSVLQQEGFETKILHINDELGYPYDKDVIVKGNPRVFKSLKDLLVNIHADLVKSSLNNPPSPELLDTIKTVSTILGLLASVENSN